MRQLCSRPMMLSSYLGMSRTSSETSWQLTRCGLSVDVGSDRCRERPSLVASSLDLYRECSNQPTTHPRLSVGKYDVARRRTGQRGLRVNMKGTNSVCARSAGHTMESVTFPVLLTGSDTLLDLYASFTLSSLTPLTSVLDSRGCPEGGSTIADRCECSRPCAGRCDSSVDSGADDVQDCLGVGSTGAVLRALDKSSGVVVAIKIANTATNLQDQKIVREVEIYRRLVASPSRALK